MLDRDNLDLLYRYYNKLKNDMIMLAKEASNYRSGDIEKYKEYLKEIYCLNIQIDTIYNMLISTRLISKHNDSSLVDIGDFIRVKTIISDNEVEENIYELVAGYNNYDLDVTKLSINSPLGKILYKAKIGDIIDYNYGDLYLKIQVIEKVNNMKKVLK